MIIIPVNIFEKFFKEKGYLLKIYQTTYNSRGKECFVHMSRNMKED